LSREGDEVNNHRDDQAVKAFQMILYQTPVINVEFIRGDFLITSATLHDYDLKTTIRIVVSKTIPASKSPK
jgi:hypothetical protein